MLKLKKKNKNQIWTRKAHSIHNTWGYIRNHIRLQHYSADTAMSAAIRIVAQQLTWHFDNVVMTTCLLSIYVVIKKIQSSISSSPRPESLRFAKSVFHKPRKLDPFLARLVQEMDVAEHEFYWINAKLEERNNSKLSFLWIDVLFYWILSYYGHFPEFIN